MYLYNLIVFVPEAEEIMFSVLQRAKLALLDKAVRQCIFVGQKGGGELKDTLEPPTP